MKFTNTQFSDKFDNAWQKFKMTDLFALNSSEWISRIPQSILNQFSRNFTHYIATIKKILWSFDKYSRSLTIWHVMKLWDEAKATLFNFSVLDQKKSNEGGQKKKHLRKKTLNLFLDRLMRATK